MKSSWERLSDVVDGLGLFYKERSRNNMKKNTWNSGLDRSAHQ